MWSGIANCNGITQKSRIEQAWQVCDSRELTAQLLHSLCHKKFLTVGSVSCEQRLLEQRNPAITWIS
jgi:hypothetical protein